MSDSENFEYRRRSAWVIVLCGFTIFLSLCVSVPVAGARYLQNTTEPLLTSVVANTGTVAIVQDNGSTAALLAADPPRTVEAPIEIVTNAADTALLLAFEPGDDNLLMRAQVYGNTRAEMRTADTPRFGFSNLDHQIDLFVTNGRIRFTLQESRRRPFNLLVHTPQGQVALNNAGRYALDVNNEETQLAVQDGTARIAAADSQQPDLTLITDQRGVLAFGGPPRGPLDTERNLVQNGDFAAGLDGWTHQDWNVELTNEPDGETRITELSGEKVLRFSRRGIGHADAGVRQPLYQDVTDYDTLKLLLSFRINEQTLGVCGTVGSECPLTVRIEYEDMNNNSLTWEQGFYANGQIAADTPDICVNCSPPYNAHLRVLPGRIYVADIDILQSLALQGLSPPRRIKSVSIIAAGHGFETDIIDVSLLAKD